MPDAEAGEPTDAPMRVASSAIRGTDSRIHEGDVGGPAGMVIGHGPQGVR